MNEIITEHDDEIELMDLLLVIWRRKLFIFGFTALMVGSTLVFLALSKTNYRTYMIIEPVVLDKKIKSEFHYGEAPGRIEALINSDDLKGKIIDKIESEKIIVDDLSFKVKIKKTPNQLVVYSDDIAPESAVTILRVLSELLNEQLLLNLNDFILMQKEKMSQVNEKFENFFYIQKKMEINLKYVEQRIVDINRLINDIEHQYDALRGNQNLMLSSLSKLPISEAVYAFNIISHVESRLDKLQSQMDHFESDRLAKQIDMISGEYGKKGFESLRLEKELIQIKIDRAVLISNGNKTIQMLSPPVVYALPHKYKKKAILLVAFASGLLLSLFSIFFLEYFKNYKKRKLEKV